MKRLLTIPILCLTLLLCGCGMSEGTIVGVWSGSGSVSMLGLSAEDGSAPLEVWTFRDDGSAALEVSLGDEIFPAAEFTYAFEEGVLTLTSGRRSVEIPCQQAGDTLVFDPEGDDPAIFTRAG